MADTVQYTAASELWAYNDKGGKADAKKSDGVQVDIIDVSYSVEIEGRVKPLLRHVNFHLEPVILI